MAEALIITTAPRDDHQLDMTVQLGPERTERALIHAVRHVQQRRQIPGFRKGKAPFATVVRLFGRKALLGEVVEEMGEEIVKEALASTEIDRFGQPELVGVEMDPPTFKLVVPLRPTATLGDYASIRVPTEPVSVSDADVAAVIEGERQERAVAQAVERPAAIGDSVLVDIRGMVGENSIMDNHDWELALRSEGGWLPGFDDAFVGLSAGESKTFTLIYPEDSTSRYKGQEATFETTVKEVRSKVALALDDEFAKSLGKYGDLADLQATVRANMIAARQADAQRQLENDAMDALVAGATFAYPPQAVDEVVDELLHDMEHRVAEIGYKLEDYLRLQGKKLDDSRTELRPSADRRLRSRLALRQLAEAEGLTAPDEDISEAVERMVEGSDDAHRAEMREMLTGPGGQAFIRRDVLTGKALVRLCAIASGLAPAETQAAAESVPVAEAQPEAVTEAQSEAEAATEA